MREQVPPQVYLHTALHQLRADLTGGMGREAAMGKVLNLAFQAGSSGGARDMAFENWAMPDRSSLPCLCSLLPASNDSSCMGTCLSLGLGTVPANT